jgi:hypothetical protein
MDEHDTFSAWLEHPTVEEHYERHCEIIGTYLDACLECIFWVYEKFGSPKWAGTGDVSHLNWAITTKEARHWLQLDGLRICNSLLKLFRQMDRLGNVYTAALQFAHIVCELFIKVAIAHLEGKSHDVILVNEVANPHGIRFTDLVSLETRNVLPPLLRLHRQSDATNLNLSCASLLPSFSCNFRLAGPTCNCKRLMYILSLSVIPPCNSIDYQYPLPA